MAETLGSLCDKLTIVKLKQWHTDSEPRLASLAQQAEQLAGEIDDHLAQAVAGQLARNRLTFAANKVFDVGRALPEPAGGTLGGLVAQLAKTNCELWHEQEKVYEIQRHPETHTDAVQVIHRLGELNLERTRQIDAIDRALLDALEEKERVS